MVDTNESDPLSRTTKVYKRKFYWVNTTKFCGGVSVDQDGYVYKFDTAPCYKWASNKKLKFNDFIRILTHNGSLLSCKEVGEEVDPF